MPSMYICILLWSLRLLIVDINHFLYFGRHLQYWTPVAERWTRTSKRG